MLSRLLIVGFALLLASCSSESREENEKYLDRLASIVLGYRDRQDSLPAGFEQGLKDGGVVLPDRGDKYRRSLLYVKCGSRGFLLRSSGRNGRDDLGRGDDMDVYYLDGHKTTREPFMDHLKTIDRGLFWASYRAMFEES